MDIRFIAGFGPITRSGEAGLAFWASALGLRFDEMAPDHHHAHELPGANVFGLWPLAQAAAATFGVEEWPADRPVPQAWVEFEMVSPEAVEAGAVELVEGGHEVLRGAHQEPWGQWVARLQSPEGLLVGLSYLRDFHPEAAIR
ncbi:glyoxalase [Amnibacterium kyonggiense]|uniref:VOC domain-containing protein n=1 Tax=Amnibacterium kyonggiense TaxID=595671 RepID=A0A4R7FSF1_9MICO|nr:glyoxalase [Amnibacterium kyonggiense]TDS80750.1 hypothetical protein CLV52_1319 [Amnibacterium kyonggiense]